MPDYLVETKLDSRKEFLTEVEDFPRYYVSSKGRVYRMKGDRLLRVKKKVNPETGYVSVNLTNEEGQTTLSLHRLVAKHFLYNDDPVNKNVVDHLIPDKEDNSIENLEWVSQSENIKRSWENTRHTEEYKEGKKDGKQTSEQGS